MRAAKFPDHQHGIRNVLVVGASTGYGLAARIAAGWGLGCATLGVFLERPPRGRRTATAGFYNSVALHRAAERDGLWAKSVNGDAFSDDVKREVVRLAREEMGPIDLVVYSLAAPKRRDPLTGVLHSSALKAIGAGYEGKTVDLVRQEVTTAAVGQATSEEVQSTVAVMGGADWQRWIDLLLSEGVLASGARTVAFSYVGPQLTWPIYRDGTIGAAKEHLKKTANLLDRQLAADRSGSAWVAVNKAVVTQASAAIPVVPLYISVLFRVMKDRGVHEGCIEQMTRLMAEHVCRRVGPALDAQGCIRLDDLELSRDVQHAVSELWPQVTTESLLQLTDFEGFRRDFNNLFGFQVDGVDYTTAVETDLRL